MHAREWVTTQTALYAIHRLIEDLKTEDRDLIEGIDWIIFPVVNPDGYEFSHTTVSGSLKVNNDKHFLIQCSTVRRSYRLIIISSRQSFTDRVKRNEIVR